MLWIWVHKNNLSLWLYVLRMQLFLCLNDQIELKNTSDWATSLKTQSQVSTVEPNCATLGLHLQIFLVPDVLTFCVLGHLKQFRFMADRFTDPVNALWSSFFCLNCQEKKRWMCSSHPPPPTDLCAQPERRSTLQRSWIDERQPCPEDLPALGWQNTDSWNNLMFEENTCF